MTFGSGVYGCLGHGNYNDVAQVPAILFSGTASTHTCMVLDLQSFIILINNFFLFQAKIVEDLLGYEVVQVSCGASHVLAVTNEHEVFSWGRGDNGK